MHPSYYRYHIFFCTNKRSGGGSCCQQYQAEEMRDYLKKRTKQLDIIGPGKVRVNIAGCMDRCKQGPVLVIYPEAIWYTWKTKADIDEILNTHLLGQQIVTRLQIL